MSIGFHRYFTHRAFKTNRFWHHIMLWGGTFAGQGSVVFWTALHRQHHPNSDRNIKDVHSPVFKGFWNAYMGWIFDLVPTDITLAKSVDVIRDRPSRFAHRHYDHIMWSYWALLLATAIAFPSMRAFIAGALIAGTWSIHQEALINSVCHDKRFGTAPHAERTHDSSRNVWWLHYLTWGQSLHNNHHAFPGSDNFGTTKCPDIGHRLICLIKAKDGGDGVGVGGEYAQQNTTAVNVVSP
jgi:stearoyl-CoA desaturase (delta-9 desaturase)